MTPPDETREFTSIPNPFITGAPVRGDSKVFFGREDHFTYVRQRLIAEKEGIVMLFAGERRSGKTSVLFQILAGRLGEGFLPIFVDMQQLAGVAGDREFFARLAQLTIAAVKDDRLVPGYYDFSEGNPVITFDRLLGDIKGISPEQQRLIFLVDEAEMLREKVVKKELSSAVLMSIASSLENKQVSFCLTGSPGLRDSDAEGWKHLLGKADYREVTFLSRDDTLRLIQKPVEGQVAYAEGVAEAIYSLTAGHPFYTQVICTNVVDYLNQARRNTLTMADLDEVIRIIIVNPPPQLVYAWEEQSPQEQIVLSLVSEESTGPQNAVTPEALIETIKKNDYPLQHLKADGLHMVMEALYKRAVLGRTREGAFYFQVDLFRQWIRQARSVWGLVEEQTPPRSRRSLWLGIAAGLVILAAGVGLWRGRAAEEEQAKVQQARETAGPVTGEIWVESEPRDVEVLVDGQVEKRTTPTMLRLKPGRHLIEVRRKDYHSWIDTMEVEADKSDTLSKIQLQRLTGRLSVTSQPPGAQVRVHNAEKDTSGVTPLQELKLPTGEYEVTVSKERYVAQPRRVVIADLADTSLDFKLQANVGALYLASEPPGARIFLDGSGQGKQTPATLDDLVVGPHQVRMELPDHYPLDTTLVVSLNRTNTVSLKLILEPALVELNSNPPGATIYLDGENTRQRTPSVLPIKPGRHQLRVEREGYAPYREEEEFLPGRKYPYSIELKPYFGVVRIVRPRSGTILIDGTTPRKVPPADIPLPVGSHTLRYTTQDTAIQVIKGDTIKISLE